MDGVKPLVGQGLPVEALKELNKQSVRSISGSVVGEPAQHSGNKLAADKAATPAPPDADQVKLFTSGSLPLKGLYEVQLFDDNKDGRVDAGDAISQYLLLMPHTGEEPKVKPVDEVA